MAPRNRFAAVWPLETGTPKIARADNNNIEESQDHVFDLLGELVYYIISIINYRESGGFKITLSSNSRRVHHVLSPASEEGHYMRHELGGPVRAAPHPLYMGFIPCMKEFMLGDDLS
jgi:hypothetical protein